LKKECEYEVVNLRLGLGLKDKPDSGSKGKKDKKKE